MAESVVAFLIQKLSDLVEGELNLLGGVKQDVVFIKDELESIRAFLKVDEAMELADPGHQIWVKQVRDVSHDIEDSFDKFIMFHQPARLHHHQRSFCGYLRKIYHQIRSTKARHQFASEVQVFKERVDVIAKRHQRYPTTTASGQQGCASSSNTWYDQRGDALLLEESELVGIQKPKQDLIDLLIDGDSCLKVISIVGMGGLGKTTLAKKVYDDTKVKGYFQSHAWVTVSKSPNIKELLKDLIQQLFDEVRQPLPPRMETMDDNQLKTHVKGFLRKTRYVLVLDDIWDINAWNAVKYALPNRDYGSRVLITTRMLNVASTSSCLDSCGCIYEMEPLSLEESWTLFCKKAFQEKECPSHLQLISNSILSKCEGLPLAIVAIGGVLASKSQVRVDDWEAVNHRLGAEVEDNDKLQSVRKILLLGYNDLPYYLKSCFLYLSGFPEDHLIEGVRLIRLWIAEGFVERKEGKTLEEVAKTYLFELVRRSLVQVVEATIDGQPRSFRLHDIVREIVLLKSRDENFLQVVGDQANASSAENFRRISIHNTLQNISQGNCLFSLDRLHSLLVFGVQGPPLEALMPLLFNGGGLKLLKTLELRDTALEIIPDELFSLFHLRYLGLRRTKVKRLPKCIRKLENLETLDLKDTDVTELPVEILKLKQLRHLLVYRYMSGPYRTFRSVCCSKAPSKLGGLQSLQKLCYIEANTILVKEIGKLTQLRRLGITKLRGEDGVALCSSIEKLTNLRSLNLFSTEEDEILDLQSLSRGAAAPLLQNLYLRGRLEKLPHWITSLHGLVKLALQWSKLRDDPLQSLQDLPNLVRLEFAYNAYEGEELRFKAGGFQRLEMLSIVKLRGLRMVIVEDGAMPNLENLIIKGCELVEELPSGVEFLTNLTLLELGDMPDALISKLNPEASYEDYSKIACIPNVWIGDSKQGQWRGNFLS